MFKHKKNYAVYTAGAPILKKKARKVDKITPEIMNIGEQMIDTMAAFDGVGLAGPQYGVDQRIVAFNIPMREEGCQSPGEALMLPMMPMVVINPEITEFGSDMLESEEGCLSLPEIWGPVVRPATVKFKAQLLNGNNIECECGGLLARCIQHELDHLDGILFVDRMEPDEFDEVEPALRRLERAGAAKEYKRRTKH